MMIALVKMLCLTLAAGWCGTHGAGQRRCVNDPNYTCNDCGRFPCVDISHSCWSCAGSDRRCYPFHCGTYCSVEPCRGGRTHKTVRVAADDAYSVKTHGLFDPPKEYVNQVAQQVRDSANTEDEVQI
eukprot:GEMP01073383.1.p1 GENE.GEMP01073383.1~~GEMP01073383.1.p1  ORF type:complete len:127 (+),score=18.84 GEMP01073383.1:74-454(+)